MNHPGIVVTQEPVRPIHPDIKIVWTRRPFRFRPDRVEVLRTRKPSLALQQNSKIIWNKSLGPLLVDPDLWTHSIWSNNQYQLARGYYDLDAYEIFGVVQTDRSALVAMYWYSPTASGFDLQLGAVFELGWDGKNLEVRPVKITRYGHRAFSRETLALRTTRSGQVLLSDYDGDHVFLGSDRWKRIRERNDPGI